MGSDIGLYIHIPFCQKKCFYCGFLSYEQNEGLYKAYQDALIQEITSHAGMIRERVKTIYIGGGTPTALPPFFLSGILKALSIFSIYKNAEITVEANPGTLTPYMLDVLKSAGCNRLSLGLQAVQDHLLARLGRVHCFEDFVRQYYLAEEKGFDNINIDLMFALPGQSLDDWRESLKKTLDFQPSHISIYGLSIEEGTVFDNMTRQGWILPTDDELDREMYCLARELLSDNRYIHYEISNFARKNQYGIHNSNYWKRKPYLGFGLGAHSFYQGKRFRNTRVLKKYLHYYNKNNFSASQNRLDNILLNKSDIHSPTPEEAMAEFMFLGLRMRAGVSIKKFYYCFNKTMDEVYDARIEELFKLDLLNRAKGRIYLTDRGIDVSNRVFGYFIL